MVVLVEKRWNKLLSTRGYAVYIVYTVYMRERVRLALDLGERTNVNDKRNVKPADTVA